MDNLFEQEQPKKELIPIDQLEISNMVSYTLPSIKYDFTDLRGSIDDLIEDLKTYEVSEKTLKKDKKLVATLNKLSKALNDERKSIEKKIKEPIVELKSAVDTMIEDIGALSRNIKDEIDIFNKKSEEEKRQKILELEEYFSEVIFDSKWLNTATTMKSIRSDLIALASQRRMAQTVIRQMIKGQLDVKDYLDLYDKCWNLEHVTNKIENDLSIKEKYVEEQPKVTIKKVESTTGITYAKTFNVTATLEQLKALADFFETNNIEYEVV